MARKIVHQLIDDLDGTLLESETGETVLFSLDGVAYEIDLKDENVAAFRSVLAPYLEAARPVSRSSSSSASTRPRRRTGQRDYTEIRSWAKANGFELSDRGRIPAAVLEAFDASR